MQQYINGAIRKMSQYSSIHIALSHKSMPVFVSVFSMQCRLSAEIFIFQCLKLMSCTSTVVVFIMFTRYCRLSVYIIRVHCFINPCMCNVSMSIGHCRLSVHFYTVFTSFVVHLRTKLCLSTNKDGFCMFWKERLHKSLSLFILIHFLGEQRS